MTEVAAVRKIQEEMVRVLRLALPDVNWFVDRSEDEPIQIAEMPAAVINVLSEEYSLADDGSGRRHDDIFQIDFHSPNQTVNTIDQVNQTNIALTINTLRANPDLSGRLSSMEERASSSARIDGADVGIAILEVAVVFFTDRNDIRIILGQAGQNF
jgi:hypothetical protein